MEGNVFGVPYARVNGVNLIASPMMRTPIHEKRTLRERLFSLPFRPFESQKVIGYKPLSFAVKVGDMIFVPPEMLESLKKAIGTAKGVN